MTILTTMAWFTMPSDSLQMFHNPSLHHRTTEMVVRDSPRVVMMIILELNMTTMGPSWKFMVVIMGHHGCFYKPRFFGGCSSVHVQMVLLVV